MKNRKSIIAIGAVVVLVIAGVLVHRLAFAKETATYRFTKIERGDMQSTVSATGTLNAVTTVSVGTQVSGQVSALLVDFNDRVKKGQLLARIDPTLAQQAVTDAQANLEKAQAQALLASRDYSRNRELTRAGLVAGSVFEQSQAGSQVAQATVKSARVALQRAQQNLSYSNIYAPIDGVVVARNVDQGQTVAASLSAPELFKIANDLSQMQILAQVGESDIAQIKEGQPVEFTVQALQGQTFKGSVKQVRLQSATQDNVVNYTVVIAVDNSEGKLLPGMTARAGFLTKSAENVLKVSNPALRFKPTEEQLAEMKKNTTRPEGETSSAAGQSPRAGRQQRLGTGSGGREGSFGSLYYLDDKGTLQVARVRTGINDGTATEILGKNVVEGMEVIAGANSTTKTATGTSASPFSGGASQQQPQRRGGPGGL